MTTKNEKYLPKHNNWQSFRGYANSLWGHAAAGIAICLLLTGCQYGPDLLPRPFQKTNTNEKILTTMVKPSMNVAVLNPEGPPEGIARTLAAAVAEKAQARDIPATSQSLEGIAYKLEGKASAALTGNVSVIVVAWDLVDPQGERLTRFLNEVRLPVTDGAGDGPWSPLGGVTINELAETTASELKGWFDAQKLSAREATARFEQSKRVITLAGVEGAPGDGDKALSDALAHALRAKGQMVRQDNAGEGYLISADVEAGDAPLEQQTIQISWNVIAPNGDFLGTVSQANNVPRDSLSSEWGPVAHYAALAAADSILSLVTEYEVSLAP